LDNTKGCCITGESEKRYFGSFLRITMEGANEKAACG
jgi:hypothetical protein